MHYSKEDEEFAQHSHIWNRILMTDEYRAELLLGGRIWSYPGLIPICDDLIVSDWQHTVTMMMLQIRNQHLHCTGICILLYNLWWVNYDEKGIEFIFTPFREFVCKKDDDATRRGGGGWSDIIQFHPLCPLSASIFSTTWRQPRPAEWTGIRDIC